MSKCKKTTVAEPFLLPAGTLLLTEKPFVYALKSQFREQRCDQCFAESNSLSKCSNCRYVYYCDRQCQRDAWPLHKYECRCLQNVAPRIVPDCARLLARLIIHLNKGGDHIKGYYTQRLYRRWRDLMTHYGDVRKDAKRMEHIESLAFVLRQLLGDQLLPNDVELVQLYGRQLVNAFNILDHDLNSIGTGIYLGVSVTDHSCAPNAVVTFDGITLCMRSTQPMRSIDFAQVFISYVDLLETGEQRRRQLRETYYFECKCERCLDGTEEARMNAAACPNARCGAALDLRPEVAEPAEQCAACGANVPMDYVRNFREILELTKSSIAEMKHTAYIDVCTVLLGKHKGLLHPLNAHHIKVLDLAFESAIDVEKWSEAVEFGLRLVPGMRLYNGECSPLLAVVQMKLGKLLLLFDRCAEAREQLQSAADIMQYTHGKQSTAYQRRLLPLLSEAGQTLQNGS